jgi:hypothetical protein
MAMPQRMSDPNPTVVALDAPRIRRCTFRRLSRIAADSGQAYEVNCLYPDRRIPLPIGDLDTSLEICGSCTAGHIFRPDED